MRTRKEIVVDKNRGLEMADNIKDRHASSSAATMLLCGLNLEVLLDIRELLAYPPIEITGSPEMIIKPPHE